MTPARLALVSLMLIGSPVQAFDLGGLQDKLGTLAQPAPSTAAAAPAATNASALAKFSNADQVGSLKQALAQGAETAVAGLAKKDGFLGNNKVRIPLPKNLQKAAAMMRKFGMGSYADDLQTSMNRAAEAAVPEAKTLLLGAVKKMTVEDAKAILTGSDDAATRYFRKNTETALAGKFKPIVGASMKKVKLAKTYDQFAGRGAQFGLVKEKDAKLNDFITNKALDGLFLMMAEQEKAIRADPLKASGNLAKKIFSAIKL